MVTVKTQDTQQNETTQDSFESENEIVFNYYILNIAKCKYDGELDSTKPFLKLISMSQFKRNCLFNIEPNIVKY